MIPSGWALILHSLAALAYAALAIASFRAMQRVHRSELGWALLVVLFGVLAIDQQFRLLDWAVNLLRDLAEQNGWYDERRRLQGEVIVGIVVFGGVIALGLLIGLRRKIWQLRLATLAGVSLLALAIIKAVSLHNIDALMARSILPALTLRLGGLVELAGMAIALFACFSVRSRLSRAPRRRRRA